MPSIIPITRLTADFIRDPYIFFMVKIRPGSAMEDAKEELRGIVRKMRRVAPGLEDDFAINQQDMVIKQFDKMGKNHAFDRVPSQNDMGSLADHKGFVRIDRVLIVPPREVLLGAGIAVLVGLSSGWFGDFGCGGSSNPDGVRLDQA